MMTAQGSFVDRIENLPPLPIVIQRIMSVTGSDDTSATDIASVLSEDPAIAAKILRVANSSFYGMARNITQVSRAVAVLGVVAVRNIALGVAVRDSLIKMVVGDVDHAAIWRHSIAVGSACEMVARHIGYRPPEEAFVAGLLHDIGQLAMMAIQPEGLDAVLREQGRGIPFLALERTHFGVDHPDAGFRIMRRWRIPDSLCQVARRHHEPRLINDGPQSQLLAIVMLSDTVAQVMGYGLDMPVGRLERAERAARVLGLDELAKMRIVDKLAQRIDQAVEMFASVDEADARHGDSHSRTALWIAPITSNARSMSELLLEHYGYAVTRVAPGIPLDGRRADLIIVAMPDEDESLRQAQALVRQGYRNPIMLADPPDGAALRRNDDVTGVCRIPRLFTAFDIHWAQRQIVS